MKVGIYIYFLISFGFFPQILNSQIHLNEDIAQIVFGSNKPGIFLFRDEAHHHLDKIFIKISEIFQNRLNLQFVISGSKEEIERRTALYLGIKISEFPIIKIMDTSFDDVREYTMRDTINEENITNFINKSFNVKIKIEEL